MVPPLCARGQVHEIWCAAATQLILVNTVMGPNAAPSPYAVAWEQTCPPGLLPRNHVGTGLLLADLN